MGTDKKARFVVNRTDRSDSLHVELTPRNGALGGDLNSPPPLHPKMEVDLGELDEPNPVDLMEETPDPTPAPPDSPVPPTAAAHNTLPISVQIPSIKKLYANSKALEARLRKRVAEVEKLKKDHGQSEENICSRIEALEAKIKMLQKWAKFFLCLYVILVVVGFIRAYKNKDKKPFWSLRRMLEVPSSVFAVYFLVGHNA